MRTHSLAEVRGSTLIEALLSIKILVLLVTLLLTGLYFNFARLWLGHWLYEGAYCLIGPQSPGICTQLVKRKAQQLPFGYITQLKLHRSSRLVRGHLRFHLFAKHDLNLKKEIHLQRTRVSGE